MTEEHHHNHAVHAMPAEVVDPVCGMTISPEDAVGTHSYHGVRYHFCNPGCLEKFKADPEHYLKPAQQESPSRNNEEAEYTCPMDPEVRQLGPGTCPKCGMALEPATFAPAKPKIEYTCPMHPEIVRGEPGSCPICGMALEPREITAEEVNPELIGMTRRFWASVVLTIPLLALMVSEMLPGKPLQGSVRAEDTALVAVRLCNARGPLGRLAVLCARLAIGREPSSEHVLADRARYRHIVLI
jgi:Cu+-exporting ATPase